VTKVLVLLHEVGVQFLEPSVATEAALHAVEEMHGRPSRPREVREWSYHRKAYHVPTIAASLVRESEVVFAFLLVGGERDWHGRDFFLLPEMLHQAGKLIVYAAHVNM